MPCMCMRLVVSVSEDFGEGGRGQRRMCLAVWGEACSFCALLGDAGEVRERLGGKGGGWIAEC